MTCELSREFWDTFMISPGLYEPWRISDSVRIQLPPWPAVDLWLVLVSYVKSRFRVEVFRVLTLSPIKRPWLVTSLGHSTPLGSWLGRMPFLLFLILLLVHGTVFWKRTFLAMSESSPYLRAFVNWNVWRRTGFESHVRRDSVIPLRGQFSLIVVLRLSMTYRPNINGACHCSQCMYLFFL